MLALQYAKKVFAGHAPVAIVHITSIQFIIIIVIIRRFFIHIPIAIMNCVVTVMVSKMGL